MVLLVKAELKSSNIHGIGVFTKEYIPRHTLVWEHDEFLDGWSEMNNSLPDAFKQYLEDYCCYDKQLNLYIIHADHCAYINHSNDPVLLSPTKYKHYAARNIEIGEELTVDYRYICDDVTEEYLRFTKE